jgi:hypothetical protein
VLNEGDVSPSAQLLKVYIAFEIYLSLPICVLRRVDGIVMMMMMMMFLYADNCETEAEESGAYVAQQYKNRLDSTVTWGAYCKAAHEII